MRDVEVGCQRQGVGNLRSRIATPQTADSSMTDQGGRDARTCSFLLHASYKLVISEDMQHQTSDQAIFEIPSKWRVLALQLRCVLLKQFPALTEEPSPAISGSAVIFGASMSSSVAAYQKGSI